MFTLQTLYKGKKELESVTTSQKLVITYNIKSDDIIEKQVLKILESRINESLNDIPYFVKK